MALTRINDRTGSCWLCVRWFGVGQGRTEVDPATRGRVDAELIDVPERIGRG
jgi:hypothetical protein